MIVCMVFMVAEGIEQKMWECLGKLIVKAVLSSSGANDEPTWLRNARQALETDVSVYIPDQGDLAVLRDIPSLITNDSEIKLQVVDEIGFRTQDDTMIALESLYWR